MLLFSFLFLLVFLVSFFVLSYVTFPSHVIVVAAIVVVVSFSF